MKTEAAAKAAGEKIRARLAPTWTVRVWENLGWHCAVHSPCGRIEVHGGDRFGFVAYLNAPGQGGGRWVERANNSPSAAVRAVIRSAVEDIKPFADLLDGPAILEEIP